MRYYLVHTHCRDFGFSDKALARAFRINPETLYAWKKKYPEFSKSIEAGKDAHDSGEVEASTLKAAKGFYYWETIKKRMLVAHLNDAGEVEEKPKMIVIKRVR